MTLVNCKSCYDRGDCLECGHTVKPHRIGCRYPFYPCVCKTLHTEHRDRFWATELIMQDDHQNSVRNGGNK